MRFGVFWLLQRAEPGRPVQDRYADVVGQAQLADELGFESAWFAEHHFSNYGLIPSPLMLISYLAGQTSRITLAPGILVLPFYQPLRLAAECAMVDVLSKGRFICGIGRGYQAMEFRGHGLRQEDSRERFDECVEILLKAWTERDWGFQGKHFQVPEGTTVVPEPLQRPHPPIWAAMWGSPESVRNAARRGWPALAGGYFRPLEFLRDLRARWDEELRLAGRDPASLPFASVRHVTVVEDAREARRYVADLRWIDDVAAALRREDQMLSGGHISAAPQADLDEDTVLARSIIGTPEQVVERIRQEQAAGVTKLLCHFDHGALPQEDVLRSMRLFRDEVMPRFAEPPLASHLTL